MRRFIAVASIVVAAVALPTVAAAGASHFVDSWSNEPVDQFAGDWCGTGRTLAGTGVESGSVKVTETSNGGSHVVGESAGTVLLYEATGNPDVGVTLGDYAGTYTYSGTFKEEHAPGGQGAFGGASQGVMVYADGTTQKVQVTWHLVPQPGDWPKLFFAHFNCGPLK